MHIYDDFMATANLQRKSSSLGYWYLDYLLLQKKISKEIIQDIATKYNTYEKFINCEYYSHYFSRKTRYDFFVYVFLDAVCRNENLSPLMYALHYEDYDKARLLIDNKVEIDRFHNNGDTALLYFCFDSRFGDALDKIKFLVENGADVNKCNEYHNCSPLHLLAQSDEVEAVKYLISKGADLNAKENRGYTPLNIALYYGNQEIIDLLSQKKPERARKKLLR